MAMAASAAAATPLLPDEILFWEILVLLPPKSLLRCRPVCRAWHHVTSTRDFLQAHHVRQPSLPIFHRFEYACDYQNILAFDHRVAAGAQLQPVARLRNNHSVKASCDGLLILSTGGMFDRCLSVCNPDTREHAPLDKAWGSRLLGMYPHRSTGEYRLLLHWSRQMESFLGFLLPKGKIGCYVLALGSDQPLSYIGGAETALTVQFDAPALVHDNLHWYQARHRNESELVLVFDTITESFRQMRPPVVFCPTTKSYIFETEGTLGISSYNDAMKIVDIWMLQNYEGEVWECKYRVKLPISEMRRQFGSREEFWKVSPVLVDGDILLLVRQSRWMFYIDTGGERIGGFHCDRTQFFQCVLQLKQSLVSHTFFTTLEGYPVNQSPFIDGRLVR